MYTARPTFKVLIVGCDNAGKTTFLEQIKKMEGKKSLSLDKIPPTIGLNIAKVMRREGEFMFWDLGGQKSLRKIWTKYFDECHGVIFVIDGADENRFYEVKAEIDNLYSRKDPSVKKTVSESLPDDIESSNQEQEYSQILEKLPCIFLLNKNDKPEFVGVDKIN